MPVNKKLPEIISAVAKILITGEQANYLAIKAYVKAEIKHELRSKPLSPEKFEADLTALVSERLHNYHRIQSIGAPFTHALDYGSMLMREFDASLAAYIEAETALRLTPNLADLIGKKILAATVASYDLNTSELEMQEENDLIGILLKKVREKTMSLGHAIKTYYIITTKDELTLEFFKARMLALPLNEQVALSDEIDDFFIKKITNNYVEKFKEEIRQELKTEEEVCVPAIIENQRYLYYRDDSFPFYCANQINGKQYIAMSGPKNSESVAALMHSLLFTETMKDKAQVTTIIALGDCVKSAQPMKEYSLEAMFNRQDFFNYCYDDSEHASKDNDNKIGKTFTVSFNAGNADQPVNYHYEINVTNRSESSCYTSSSGFVLSELDVNGKKLEVLLIGLPDGDSLDLGIDSIETEQLKELFWKISQKPATEATAVHCAAGVGRTGHIILMLDIFKNYQHIMASDKPDVIAREIDALVINMRATRPALVYSLEQYIAAIENADILYQYALQKGYIAEPASLAASSFLASKSSSQAQQIDRVEDQRSARLLR